jgi:hypothetical protein
VPTEDLRKSQLRPDFDQFQTIHKKYPQDSENQVYQRFRMREDKKQLFGKEETYSGQIYVIKKNQNKKRKLKQHKLCAEDDQSKNYGVPNYQDNPQEAQKGDSPLQFDSKFESGNLFAAFQVLISS